VNGSAQQCELLSNLVFSVVVYAGYLIDAATSSSPSSGVPLLFSTSLSLRRIVR
jgi:hypothetical protein